MAIFTTPAGSKQETDILPPTNTVGAYIPDTPAPAAETVEPTEPAVRYHLTDAERDVVERVVMAEAGGESFEGQMLVAQCILEMKPGETLHLRSGRDLELESVTPVTCGVMLTFNVTERKEHNNER